MHAMDMVSSSSSTPPHPMIDLRTTSTILLGSCCCSCLEDRCGAQRTEGWRGPEGSDDRFGAQRRIGEEQSDDGNCIFIPVSVVCDCRRRLTGKRFDRCSDWCRMFVDDFDEAVRISQVEAWEDLCWLREFH